MQPGLRSCLAMILLLVASAASAAFHLFRIEQLYSNADGTVQFVVMHQEPAANGENFWAGNALTSTHGSGTKVFTFLANLPGSATSGRRVLVATPGFAALGLVTPDYVMPSGFLPTDGGTVNYAGVDQVTYSSLPTDGVTAINRNGTMIPNVATNFAGASASVPATVPPSTLDLDQHGLTGSWYEPATSGQGVEVEIFPDLAGPGTGVVQVSWFTFDANAAGGPERQRWYTLGGNAASGAASATLAIYQNVGGNFNAAPITAATQVGTATLRFSACDRGTLDYAFSDGSGRAGSIDLTRLTRNVTCASSGARPVNADFAFSGNWFDPATSGQGITVEINPLSPVAFLAWYTYAPAGAGAGAAGQRWYTAQSGYAPGARTLAMTLFETTGGRFDAPTTPPPATVAVGTATLAFQSCAAATLDYSFTGGSSSGAAGKIVLHRVGPVPPGCAM